MTLCQQQLLHNKVNLASLIGDSSLANGIAFSKVENPMLQEFKSLWRKKGDLLSKQYTGTDSTISTVSENLKEGFWGKVSHKLVLGKRLLVNTINKNEN